MDKLQENLFPISVGAIGVVLLVLIYFLIYSPLSRLGATENRLASATMALQQYKRAEFVPTESFVTEYMKRQVEVTEGDVADAADWYYKKVEKFQLFFDESPHQPAQAQFEAALGGRVDDVLRQYQSDFGLAALNADELTLGPPAVDILQSALSETPPNVMKEFWIFDEIVKACSELGIGGLQRIGFPLRGNLPQREYFQIIAVRVDVFMPYSKIEDLVSALYRSERALFQIEEVMSKNQPTQVGPYEELYRDKTYPTRSSALTPEEAYDRLYPEPAATVLLRFHVFDWRGLPLEEELEEP